MIRKSKKKNFVFKQTNRKSAIAVKLSCSVIENTHIKPSPERK